MTVQQKPNPAVPPASFDVEAFNQFELNGWEGVGVAWHRHFAAVSVQAADRLIDAAGLTAPGAATRILDVATGPGYAAAAAAARGADAVGVDFAAAQIEIAQQLYPRARFQVANAEALPFPDEEFDAVVMNFGLLHFPHPERALAEAYRVLRPGGRIAFTVWASPAKTRGFGIVEEAIAAHGDPSATIPDGPFYFRFADPGEARRALEGAGFAGSTTDEIELVWRLDDPVEVVQAVGNGTVRAGARLRAQPPERRASVEAAIVEAVSEYSRSGGIELPMGAALTAAGKP